MDIQAVMQGTALVIDVELLDSQAQPITTYQGSEPLSALIWPGGDRASQATVSASWVSGPGGTITISLTAAQTAALSEGRWYGELALADPTYGPFLAYSWAMDVSPAPGTATAPRSYVTYADLLTYGRGWLANLDGPDDQAGFARQCGAATGWLDKLVLDRFDVPNAWIDAFPGYGSPAWGAGGTALPSLWLRGILCAGGLVVRPWVIEAVAKHALALICEGQVGPSKEGQEFARLGRWYRGEASSIAQASRAEVIVPSDGQPVDPMALPTLCVNLGCTNVRGLEWP